MLKDTHHIVQKNIFVIRKIKNAVPRTYFINDLNNSEIIGTVYEKGLLKTNQREFRIEKVIKKKKVINYMSNGKVLIVHLIAGLIRAIW